jgi:hypothetical protein
MGLPFGPAQMRFRLRTLVRLIAELAGVYRPFPSALTELVSR